MTAFFILGGLFCIGVDSVGTGVWWMGVCLVIAGVANGIGLVARQAATPAAAMSGRLPLEPGHSVGDGLASWATRGRRWAHGRCLCSWSRRFASGMVVAVGMAGSCRRGLKRRCGGWIRSRHRHPVATAHSGAPRGCQGMRPSGWSGPARGSSLAPDRVGTAAGERFLGGDSRPVAQRGSPAERRRCVGPGCVGCRLWGQPHR